MTGTRKSEKIPESQKQYSVVQSIYGIKQMSFCSVGNEIKQVVGGFFIFPILW